jgi:hypothetical protein
MIYANFWNFLPLASINIYVSEPNFTCKYATYEQWQTYCQYKVQQPEWRSSTVHDVLLVQILAFRMTSVNSDRLTVNILLISASIRSLVLGLRSFTTTRPELFPSCVRNPTLSDIPQSFTMCMAIEVACWTNRDKHNSHCFTVHFHIVYLIIQLMHYYHILH